MCRSPAEAAEVLSHGLSLLAEEFVPFERELAVLIARSPSGHGAAYPVVQTIQRDGICHEVLAPAPGLADDIAEYAIQLGLELAQGSGRDRAARGRAVPDPPRPARE